MRLSHYLSLLAFPLAAFSQTASDPNEGTRVMKTGTNNYQLSWWARPGAYYLIEYSTDLQNWTYYNSVLQGVGSVSNYTFTGVTSNRFFMRLQKDPFGTDTDHDGIPDGWEVQNALNPRSASDASSDPDSDGYTNLEEYVLGLAPFTDEYAAGFRTQTYTYDAAGRVTAVNSSFPETFAYDAEGNLTNSQ